MTPWEFSYTIESNETILALIRDAIKQVPASIPRKLEKLDREGWELAAITNASENGSVWHLVFRRQR
jgi:hypothetical protein